ncbi:hypothetical protein B0H14DRAFT_2558371 [Mycena olivaceomarginata]|nr:hypothetical protein B0H14DRAFT_2558371 [Mycena olivaceomarginata]
MARTCKKRVKNANRRVLGKAPANPVFNPDDSWETVEIMSCPNTPVVVEHPQPETCPLAHKNLVKELLQLTLNDIVFNTGRVPGPSSRAFVLMETQKKLLKDNKLNYITRLLNVLWHKLLKNNVLKRTRTAALNVLSPEEKELIKLLRDALEEGCKLRNIQEHKRLGTATALERTSIATNMPPDLYHILEGLLASAPRHLKVGSEWEPNAPEVLFAPKGTYVSVSQMQEDLLVMRRELEELEGWLVEEKMCQDLVVMRRELEELEERPAEEKAEKMGKRKAKKEAKRQKKVTGDA